MSHFTVMVIGNNPEDQLKPYDENLEAVPYRDVDFDPDAYLAQALEWAANPTNTDKHFRRYALLDVENLSSADRIEILVDYDGGDVRAETIDGVETIVRYSTYNPLSKWDWYQIGGRWSDRLVLTLKASLSHGRPTVDQALKSEIDFASMRAEAERRALEEFEAFTERVRGISKPEYSLTELRDSLTDATLPAEPDLAAWRGIVQTYKAHPWVAAAIGDEASFFFADPYETFRLDAEDPQSSYVKRQTALVTATFAIVHEGAWSARGDMGWFGAVNPALDGEDFAERQWKLIESLPDDTLITMIDCHI